MNKVALITGSSRGIGRAEAVRLAKDGFCVCINYIEQKGKADEVVNSLNAQGYSAISFQADVSDRIAVDSMIHRIHEEFGPISVLVNNAGIAEQNQIQDITMDFWDRIFDVNVKGTFNTIQAVLPDMLKRKEGCIVNTSSIWGLHGASCESAYSSTKHAIIGLTKSLAAELAPSGIRVNCIAPGVINTDMVKVLGDETLKLLVESTPLGRLGTPEDIANVLSFLVSDQSSYITGQIITCDGGFVNL